MFFFVIGAQFLKHDSDKLRPEGVLIFQLRSYIVKYWLKHRGKKLPQKVRSFNVRKIYDFIMHSSREK
jgi:hypothetical protein